jgi:hypothetical protein
MKIATCTLVSASALMQSRMHQTPKLDRENADDYEKRTWKNRAHIDNDGNVFIPGAAFKKALQDAAKFLNIQIHGKGKSTYTKHFKSGVLVFDNVLTGKTAKDILCVPINCNSDGVAGSGKRVLRMFPSLSSWSGELTAHLIDDTITREVFEEVLTAAGQFMGVGSFRPQNGNNCGRFDHMEIKWQDA